MASRFPLLILCGCCAAVGQDEPKLVAAFQKAFYASKKGAVPAAERAAALAALGDLDSVNVADALVEAWRALEAELAPIEAERQAASAELAELIKGQETAKERTLPNEKHARYLELQKSVPLLRERVDGLRDLQQRVANRIGSVRRKDSLLALLHKVVQDKKEPFPLRLAAGRALGGGAIDIVEELGQALARSKDVEEQIVLLDAMVLAGPVAKLHATPVIAALQSPHDTVRERAALALAKIAVPEAIAPMIDLLGRSTGQTRQRIASALAVPTGQQHGDNLGAWQAWWQSEGKAVAAGGEGVGGQLGRGTPSHRKATDQNYYFGIPQSQSSSILYVIDCSGSMEKAIEMKLEGDAEPRKASRLEGCKRELVRALGLLRPEQKFAILWYNDLPHWWEPKLQPATKDVVARAQAFVKTLQHASSTNIYESLEKGFTLVGRGVRDQQYGVELDTIFLLTDGSPTKTDGKPDSTEKILEAVRIWNPLQRVTLHTIGIGKELNEPFLRQLAQENGGQYRQF
jgi:HEAT repeat protein